MNDGTLKKARRLPAKAPRAVASRIASTIASGRLRFQSATAVAMITEVKATAGPMLMSISPAMMTKVMPQATMPTVAAVRRIPSWLLVEVNPVAVVASTMNRMTMPTNSPISLSCWAVRGRRRLVSGAVPPSARSGRVPGFVTMIGSLTCARRCWR
jgi:hypothetical protein